jgi:hypothetical protein
MKKITGRPAIGIVERDGGIGRKCFIAFIRTTCFMKDRGQAVQCKAGIAEFINAHEKREPRRKMERGVDDYDEPSESVRSKNIRQLRFVVPMYV